MGDVLEFPGTNGYDEALFRQVLGVEMDECSGILTEMAIAQAFLKSLPDAETIKKEDPNAFDDYVKLMFAVIEFEQASGGPNWRP